MQQMEVKQFGGLLHFAAKNFGETLQFALGNFGELQEIEGVKSRIGEKRNGDFWCFYFQNKL